MRHIYLCLMVLFSVCGSLNPLFAQWVKTALDTGFVGGFAAKGAYLFAGIADGNGVFSSTDNGTSWTQVNNGLSNTSVNALAASPDSPGNLLAGSEGSGVFLSTNDGTSWNQTGLTNANVWALAVSDTNLFAGTEFGGVYLSTNDGTSWNQVDTGLTVPFVTSFAVSDTDLFAGTYRHGVFLSTNNGKNWTQTGLTNPYVWALVTSGMNLFAGTAGGDGVFLSTDNGARWTAVNNEFPKDPDDTTVYGYVNALAVSGANLLAGTDFAGVYLSTNSGASWISVNDGFPKMLDDSTRYLPVHALQVFGTDLFAGTENGGVWRRPLSEMITSVETCPTNLPVHYSLSQNFPNPFNPSTSIRFELGGAGFVSLRVYDVLGNVVATLENGEMKQGGYQVTWKATGLSSGIYLCRLQAGNFVDIRKLILLK